MSASLLGLLAIQSGQISNPSTQDGATGGSSLDVDQRACELGAPVPIVFARRRNDKGGILVAPGATEARFVNNAANAVTAYYHLVISEGEIDSIPVRDVFQRACRVGSHTQTYDRRAGVWLPGNYIVQRAGYSKPEASSYCGSIGLYSGMSTLSFESTIPDGFDQWRKQVHLFIRGGMYVTRLFDSVTGPSDNFADLVLWMLQNSGRVPASLIDQPALLNAAKFLEANGFTCNVEVKEATNILDFIANWAPYFLLGESNNGGKKGLRPLLPTNADGTLKTTAINVEYTFNESLIVPDSFSIEYINYADRLPFVAQLTWRQELGTDAAIVRTSEVRFDNTSTSGPFESYDLSAFCTSEDHAVKIGAYIVVRRATVTHNISFTAKPQAHNTILSPGSIVRVVFARESNSDAPSVHNYFYRVERITKTLTGEVGYECSHFPIDSEGRSIISLYVASAVGNGALFTSNQTGVTCDLPGREDDLTIPPEVFFPDPDIPGWEWDPDTDEWVPDPDIPGWEWDPDTDEWVPDPDIPGWEWDPDTDEWVPDPDIPGFDPDLELDPEPDPEPDYPPIDVFDPPIDLDPPGGGDGGGIGSDIGSGSDIGVDIGGGIGGIGGGGPGDPGEPGDEPGDEPGGGGADDPNYPLDPVDPVDEPDYPGDPGGNPGDGLDPQRDTGTPGGGDDSPFNPDSSPFFSTGGVPTTVRVEAEAYNESVEGISCSTGLPVNFPPGTTTYLGFATISNVIQWRVTNLSYEAEITCGPPGAIESFSCILEGTRADGTVVTDGLQGLNISLTTSTTARRISGTRKILSLRYDGFLMNLTDFFPPS
jgi:hypothetical protein